MRRGRVARSEAARFVLRTEVGSSRSSADFVVETRDRILMLEVKARKDLSEPEVKAKAEAAVTWCEHASSYADAQGGKRWGYAVIPHDLVSESMSMGGLLERALLSAAAAPA